MKADCVILLMCENDHVLKYYYYCQYWMTNEMCQTRPMNNVKMKWKWTIEMTNIINWANEWLLISNNSDNE